MTSYQVQVDVPIIARVKAADDEAAELLGDDLVAEAWEVMNRALRESSVGDRVSLGGRYDDTDVTEDWLDLEDDPEDVE